MCPYGTPPKVVSFFLGCVDKNDADRRYGQTQTATQRQRLRVGKEEQQNECALTFIKKVGANVMTFAPTWYG